MMVGFAGSRGLNDCRFSVSVGFFPLFFHEFLKTVGFVSLRDFNDGIGFQCQSVLLCYEISKTVGFVRL